MSQDEAAIRQAALAHLDKQETNAGDKLERSQAFVKTQAKAYQAAKEAYEKAFRADGELKKVVKRNGEKIAQRRTQLLDGGGLGQLDELLQPLDLELAEVPGPPPVQDPSVPEAPEPVTPATNRSTKKGIAKKVSSSTRKDLGVGDDGPYRVHKRKELAVADVDGAPTRRSMRGKRNLDDEEQDVYADDEQDEDGGGDYDEEDDDNEDEDRSQRAESVQSILSHITLARKVSKDPMPAGHNEPEFQLQPLPYDAEFEEQYKCMFGTDGANAGWPLPGDPMDWSNQTPLQGSAGDFGFLGPDMSNTRPEDIGMGGMTLDGGQNGAASPSESSDASNGSGLFVSERPETKPPWERRPRDPSSLDRMSADPETQSFVLGYSLRAPDAEADAATPYPMQPPERSKSAERAGSPGVGEIVSQRDRSASLGSLFGEDDEQLLTPEPSGSHAYSGDPSNNNMQGRGTSKPSMGEGPFVPRQTPAAPYLALPQQANATMSSTKKPSPAGAGKGAEEKTPKKGKSILDTLRKGRW